MEMIDAARGRQVHRSCCALECRRRELDETYYVRAGALQPHFRCMAPLGDLISAGQKLNGEYGAVDGCVLARTVFGVHACCRK
ncbi:hypothetical protein M405DRAFT_835458 [Rhizopogon salebrosus TDB-379]|nr:hypothetical protein M405DRAFT_835458 [Rhizopogon salebrosus TDB-379]